MQQYCLWMCLYPPQVFSSQDIRSFLNRSSAEGCGQRDQRCHLFTHFPFSIIEHMNPSHQEGARALSLMDLPLQGFLFPSLCLSNNINLPCHIKILMIIPSATTCIWLKKVFPLGYSMWLNIKWKSSFFYLTISENQGKNNIQLLNLKCLCPYCNFFFLNQESPSALIRAVSQLPARNGSLDPFRLTESVNCWATW